MSKEEMQWFAFDMRVEGYGYEAIAEFFDVSIFYAKILVTNAIQKEQLGKWKKKDTLNLKTL